MAAILRVANVHFNTGATNRMEYLGNNIIRFSSNGAVQVAVGNTAQRPPHANGIIRYNTDFQQFEFSNNSVWANVAGPDTSIAPAFDKANSANSLAFASGIAASAAYDKANTADSNAGTADGKAVVADAKAVASFALANTVNLIARFASITGNTAFDKANTANIIAVSAFIQANLKSTVAEYRANTGSNTLTPDIVWSALQPVALTDAATIAVDFSTGVDFTVTLGGNRTLGNPTNVKPGQRGRIRIAQDGTGSRTLAYSSFWDFAGGLTPTLSTAIGAVDYLDYDCVSATSIRASLSKAWS